MVAVKIPPSGKQYFYFGTLCPEVEKAGERYQPLPGWVRALPARRAVSRDQTAAPTKRHSPAARPRVLRDKSRRRCWLELPLGSDWGFEHAKTFIHKFILTDIEHKKLFYDCKTSLQEVVQGHYEEELNYRLISEEGPDHDKRFSVEARIGERVIGTGIGHTKKAAEQEAAYQALLLLKPVQKK